MQSLFVDIFITSGSGVPSLGTFEFKFRKYVAEFTKFKFNICNCLAYFNQKRHKDANAKCCTLPAESFCNVNHMAEFFTDDFSTFKDTKHVCTFGFRKDTYNVGYIFVHRLNQSSVYLVKT